MHYAENLSFESILKGLPEFDRFAPKLCAENKKLSKRFAIGLASMKFYCRYGIHREIELYCRYILLLMPGNKLVLLFVFSSRICNSKSIRKERTFSRWRLQEGRFSNRWTMEVVEVQAKKMPLWSSEGSKRWINDGTISKPKASPSGIIHQMTNNTAGTTTTEARWKNAQNPWFSLGGKKKAASHLLLTRINICPAACWLFLRKYDRRVSYLCMLVWLIFLPETDWRITQTTGTPCCFHSGSFPSGPFPRRPSWRPWGRLEATSTAFGVNK